MPNSKQFIDILKYTGLFYLVFYCAQLIQLDQGELIYSISPIILFAYFFQFLLKKFKTYFFPLLFIGISIILFDWLNALILNLILFSYSFIIIKKIKWFYKLGLSMMIGVFFILILEDKIPIGDLYLIAPYLLSILMFKVIIVLYEFKFDNELLSPKKSYSYFFAFPQLVYPIMPIVDHKQFVNGMDIEISNKLSYKAFKQFITGLFLFVLYKITTHHFKFTISEIYDVGDVFLYAITKSLILIKICSLFLFSLGYISMFQINLPSAFGFFPLANSFREYWKDVNRYWRDFLLKIIYFPLHFKIRKTNIPFKMFWVITATFICSSFFHFYQLYLSTGYLTIKYNDILYWLLLGFLVLYSNKRLERQLQFPKKNKYQSNLFYNSFSILVVQVTMTFLFFLWSCTNLNEFLFVLKRGNSFNYGFILIVIILWIILFFLSFIRKYIETWIQSQKLVLLASILVIGLIIIGKSLEKDITRVNLGFLYQLNDLSEDTEVNEIGYYSKLLSSNSNPKLSKEGVSRTKPMSKASYRVNNILRQELSPSKQFVFNSSVITTNSFGMRDMEYSVTKGDKTERIAILGGSYEMGTGVEDEQVFESITEKWMNQYSGMKYEILNFAVPMYGLWQEKYVLENKVNKFKPNKVVLFSHTQEDKRFLNSLSRLISEGFVFKEELICFILEKSGVKQRMSQIEIKLRLAPYIKPLFLWTYIEMVKFCHTNKITPIWVYLPTTNHKYISNFDQRELQNLARKAGFIIFELNDVYQGYNQNLIRVGRNDAHPSALGHVLIAGNFFTVLKEVEYGKRSN